MSKAWKGRRTLTRYLPQVQSVLPVYILSCFFEELSKAHGISGHALRRCLSAVRIAGTR